MLRNTIIRNGATRSNLTAAAARFKLGQFAVGVDRAVFMNPVVPVHLPGLSPFQYDAMQFSSTANAADELIDLLNREHAEEIENNSIAMPDSLKDLHSQLTQNQGWKIVSDDNSAMTKLYKTVDTAKVQVSFHCQDAAEPMDEEDEQPNEEQEERAASVRFTISVTKSGKTLVLVCIVDDGMIRIQNTAMAGSVQDIDSLHSTGINPNLYQGPEFTELAEDLQVAFHAYIEDYLGIDSDVAAYISMQFDFQEQCQYVKFLEETKSLIA